MHPSNKVTLENVKDVVRYHRPTADQARRHEALSLATEHFITALLENCPDCADRSAAIRHARDAKMTASAAVALEEGHEPAEGPKPSGQDGNVLAPSSTDTTATSPSTSSSDAPPAPQPPPKEEPPVEAKGPGFGFSVTRQGG